MQKSYWRLHPTETVSVDIVSVLSTAFRSLQGNGSHSTDNNTDMSAAAKSVDINSNIATRWKDKSQQRISTVCGRQLWKQYCVERTTNKSIGLQGDGGGKGKDSNKWKGYCCFKMSAFSYRQRQSDDLKDASNRLWATWRDVNKEHLDTNRFISWAVYPPKWMAYKALWKM